jgi:hypothetical protein
MMGRFYFFLLSFTNPMIFYATKTTKTIATSELAYLRAMISTAVAFIAIRHLIVPFIHKTE